MKKFKVFINADDFGLNDSRNEGVLYAYKKGFIDKISLVVNMDSSDRAVSLSKINCFSDIVGLHINLTEGKPLTENIRNTIYCDKNGFFVSSNPRNLRKVFSLSNIVFLRAEIEAQINKFLNYGYELNCIDFHNDIFYNIPVFLAVKPLLKKYNVKIVRGLEPYLFGYYRKSIISYLPLKYYFMFCYLIGKKIYKTKILKGGRNINQYVLDYNNKKNKFIGSMSHLNVIEIITHPDMVKNVCIDRTNFDKRRVRYSIEDTLSKLNKTLFTRLKFNELLNLI